MKRYANASGNSGVLRHRSDTGSIIVQFQDGDTYEYTDSSAGAQAIASMQRLAREGSGLSTFIAQHDPPYARKF